MAKKSFESSMQELEKLVEKLEENDVPLEDALSLYEKGIGLVKSCQEFLNRAEGKFKVLLDGEEKNINLQDSAIVSLDDIEQDQ